MRDLQSDLAARVTSLMASATETRRLSDHLHQYETNCKAAAEKRSEFLSLAETVLTLADWHHLDLWARYLKMKAETNETHALYRGQCFAHFAQKTYSPHDSEVRVRCDAVLQMDPAQRASDKSDVQSGIDTP